MVDHVRRFCTRHNLQGTTLVVGLSGGPDSVALLHILNQLKKEVALTLIAAHVDHQWRTTSGEDAAFCQSFAASLGLPFVTIKASESTVPYRGSREEQARVLRRKFFASIPADYIALAHHQDDQQETFFLRLIRGASITGLAGMQERAGNYLRPLLSCYKKDIHAYLQEHNLSYCTDSTNEDPSYLRNNIRLKVMPALKACDARVDKTFAHTLEQLRETESFLERLTKEQFERMLIGPLTISLPAFLAQDTFLQRRLLLYWLCQGKVPFTPSAGLLHEILRFLKEGEGNHTFHGWSIVKKKNTLILDKVP